MKLGWFGILVGVAALVLIFSQVSAAVKEDELDWMVESNIARKDTEISESDELVVLKRFRDETEDTGLDLAERTIDPIGPIGPIGPIRQWSWRLVYWCFWIYLPLPWFWRPWSVWWYWNPWWPWYWRGGYWYASWFYWWRWPGCIQFPICVRHYWIWVEPHYSTFDGVPYDYHGTCAHTMSKTCGNDSLPQFEIVAEHHYATAAQAAKKVSTVKRVIVEMYGFAISVGQGKAVTVNGQAALQEQVLVSGDSWIVVARTGSNVIILADCGLHVTFDGVSRLTINIPEMFAGEVCGMSGNFDDDPNNEFVFPNGTQASSILAFGHAWKSEKYSSPTCEAAEEVTLTCTAAQVAQINVWCGRMQHPVFAGCADEVPAADMMIACRYDMCADYGNMDLLCQHLSMYADECAMVVGSDINWRAVIPGCAISCPANSHWQDNVRPCDINTCLIPEASKYCSNLTADEAMGAGTVLSSGGCLCNSGYLMEGEVCIPENRCGCVDANGVYHQVGEVWTECGKSCTCHQNDRIQCTCGDLTSCDSELHKTVLCACASPRCPRICTISKTGQLTNVGSSEQLANSFKTMIATTREHEKDPCKAQLQVRMDQGQVSFLGVNIAEWPGQPSRFGRNYAFNLWESIGLSVRGYQIKGILEYTTAPPVWTNGVVKVAVTRPSANSWKLEAHCDGHRMLTVEYGVVGKPLINIDVPIPAIWDGPCYD